MKILLQHKNMVAGGIERALVSFINHLKEKSCIELFLFNKGGSFIDQIPQNIKIYESEKMKKFNPVDTGKNSNKKRSKTKQFVFKIAKLLGIKNFLFKSALYQEKRIDGYDVAIAFHGLDYLSLKFVIERVMAKKKFAIIHLDPDKIKISTKTLKLLSKYDKIICVSESCAKVFTRKFPQLKEKVDFLYNFVDIDEIKNKAKEIKIFYPDNVINIVSVSRLSEEKGFLRSLKIFKKLKDEGYNFCWHVIGDGPMRQTIDSYVNKNNLKDNVILYGKKLNPYPYLKEADVSYLGSFHESFGLVLIESMILNTPVITTQTCSAKEIIGDKGFVCENNEKGIYSTLKTVLDKKDLLIQKKLLLSNYCYDNDKIQKKISDWFKE